MKSRRGICFFFIEPIISLKNEQKPFEINKGSFDFSASISKDIDEALFFVR